MRLHGVHYYVYTSAEMSINGLLFWRKVHKWSWGEVGREGSLLLFFKYCVSPPAERGSGKRQVFLHRLQLLLATQISLLAALSSFFCIGVGWTKRDPICWHISTRIDIKSHNPTWYLLPWSVHCSQYCSSVHHYRSQYQWYQEKECFLSVKANLSVPKINFYLPLNMDKF